MKKIILSGYASLILSVVFMIAVSIYSQMFYLSIASILWCVYVTNTLIKLNNPGPEKLSSGLKTCGYIGGIKFVIASVLIPIGALTSGLSAIQEIGYFLLIVYPLSGLYYLVVTLKYFNNKTHLNPLIQSSVE